MAAGGLLRHFDELPNMAGRTNFIGEQTIARMKDIDAGGTRMCK